MTLDPNHEYTAVICAEYTHDIIMCPVTHEHASFVEAVKEYEKFKDKIASIMDGMKTPQLQCIRVVVLHRLTEILPIVGRA